MLADAMDVTFGNGDVSALRARWIALVHGQAARGRAQAAPAASPHGDDRLATWRLLLDAGALQEGEPHLAPPLADRSPHERVNSARARTERRC